jgi:hypothetical protein
MFITSMGIFGFLSKAHLDQAVPTGDVAAKVQILDEKIKTERDTIESARRALSQLDSAVDQTMSRSNDEKGAERAVQIRRNQARERNILQNEIGTAQKKIAAYNEERAPIASELRKVEAEVGPIKYIAALIYGDNPDANLLEKAGRWVIIILVLVFDPLAIMMVLAATESIRWERQGKRGIDFEEDSEVINWFAKAKERARFWDRQQEPQDQPDIPKSTRFAGFPWPMTSVFGNPKVVDKEPNYEPDDGPLTDEQVTQIKEIVKDDLPTGNVIIKESLFEDPELDVSDERPGDYITDNDKEAMRQWKEANPDNTIKHQRDLLEHGKIDHLPWEDLKLQPDNVAPHAGTMLGFGTAFPTSVIKGDTFLRVDRIPSALYKFNGSRWIEVDKSLSDQYAYDAAYIDHLISKIESGEYDPELLSSAEQDQIEYRLKHK